MQRYSEALINRHNWLDTRQYLKYCAEVRQYKMVTVAFARGALDHLLRWATKVPLADVSNLRPVFPVYLDACDLAIDYRQKVLAITRDFLTWVQGQYPERYGKVKKAWIDSLRSKKKAGSVEERQFYTLAMVQAFLSVIPRSQAEKRDQAAAAFLFLSGMRVSAFCSLPLKAVDWSHTPPRVRQWPDWGVRTKNSDAANTFLLAGNELHDLNQAAYEWHQQAEAAIGPEGMWYSLMERDGETFSPQQIPGVNRDDVLRVRLHELCEHAGIPYLSPHKFRHGHIVYALHQCRTMGDFKAVSQNVMHRQMSTTDSYYSGLREQDVAERIAHLCHTSEMDRESFITALVDVLFERGVVLK